MLEWLKKSFLKGKKEAEENPKRYISVPAVLYRYRSLNEFAISSLTQNNLYAARPDQLNDVFDGRFHVIPRKLSKEEESQLKSEQVNGNILAQKLKKDLTSGEYFYGASNEVIGDFDFPESIFQSLKSEVEGPSIGCGICCFSETPASIPMWAHYGDNHQGICIEYSTTETTFFKLSNGEIYLMPVNYNDNLVRLDPMQLVKYKYGLVLNAIAQYKSPEWSYEKEWRLIFSNGGILFDSPFKITKVIFGNRVSTKSINKVISALGIDADILYYVCMAEKAKYGMKIIPVEMAFGPIMHINSIFKEMQELAKGRIAKKNKPHEEKTENV